MAWLGMGDQKFAVIDNQPLLLGSLRICRRAKAEEVELSKEKPDAG